MNEDKKDGAGETGDAAAEAGSAPEARDDGSSSEVSDQEAQPPAQAVIAAFGGIRPMASKLGVAVSTVQGWKQRALIPPGRHDDIRAAADREGLALDPGILAAASHHETGLQEAGDQVTEQPADQSLAAEIAAGDGADDSEPEPEAPEAEPDADQTTEAGSEPAPGPAPRKSRVPTALVAGMVLGALLLGGGFAAAVALRAHWLPLFVVEQDQGDAVADLLAVIDSLEGRIATLEGRGGGDTAGLEAQVGELSGRLGALETRDEPLGNRVASLESELGLLADELARSSGLSPEAVERLSGSQAALQARLATLEGTSDRLAQLTARVDNLAADAAAPSGPPADLSFLLAAFQLRDALERGAAFAGPLAALQGGLGGDPALSAGFDKLADFADLGVPTLELLEARYPAMAKAAVAAERTATTGEGWWAGALRRVLDLVPLRRVGLVEGDSASARVARAEVHLRAGDLDRAIAELEAMTGVPRSAADVWLEEARARAAAGATLAALTARIGQAAGGGE